MAIFRSWSRSRLSYVDRATSEGKLLGKHIYLGLLNYNSPRIYWIAIRNTCCFEDVWAESGRKAVCAGMLNCLPANVRD